MEQEVLLEKERTVLLESLWLEHRGRSGEGSLALYVALGSPRPNLDSLTQKMFVALSEYPNSQYWASTFGRVLICVRPGCIEECVLGRVKDIKNKMYVPISTTRKLSFQELQQLVEPFPGGSEGTIVMNNQPATIEAFLISYIHMLDELIWDIYRNDSRAERRYSQALEFVRQNRFSVTFGSEDEILQLRMINPRVPVRLYGSGVNRDVPRVMGGIIYG